MVKTKHKPKAARRSQSKSKSASTLAKAQSKAKARHARMPAYAKTHRPPQSWFDEDGCPFQPTKG